MTQEEFEKAKEIFSCIEGSMGAIEKIRRVTKPEYIRIAQGSEREYAILYLDEDVMQQVIALLVNNFTRKMEEKYRELEELGSTAPATSSEQVSPWRSRDIVPEDGKKYIIRNTKGATFFYEPVNGAWPAWVEKWMPIPE